ncbi:hypothetical protein [Oceanicola sp. 502str15]|uniref:hypothetical protein n=1 Tax=Oceanicola sp. 502str15 TaxID=2696061 RepID=UPI00209583CB|nr:hypothetical protein [Oceanicola sp. 502str15]MCO6381301.1 hypothetical protein [Oceanicola sp. 502str15]
MRSSLSAIALLAFLSACGGGGDGNPVTGGPVQPGEDNDSGTDNDSAITTGSDVQRLAGNVKGVTHFPPDATHPNGYIVVDNLPFDGPEGSGLERYTPMGFALVSGFTAYESGDPTAETNQVKYFAVYGEGAYATAAAVGTGDYQDFGYGGAQYTRNQAGTPVDSGGLGEAVYNGSYAGVRVSNHGNSAGDVSFTTGNATIVVDFLDFETTGAIQGSITNRQVFASDGTSNGEDLPVIQLSVAFSDSAGFITNGSASSQDRTGTNAGNTFETGSWEGAFAGPNSEEVVGLIVITGPATETGRDVNGNPDENVVDEFRAQETGVFIATNP